MLERLADRRPAPSGVEVERAGSVTVRVHRPPAAPGGPLPAVLWIHGGGYVIGFAAQDDRSCADLARRLGAVVVAVDYRKGPEHPYPAALDDCHDALVWLASLPGVDRRRVAIAGASAGGGLAAALALAARDRGEVEPAFQLLVYPMLDDRTTLRPDLDDRHLRLWSGRSNRFGWRSYLGADPGFPGVAPTAAPARADDLSGLPPAWVGVGTLDLFHDEDAEYARRLREAGVACELEVVQGAFHGFDVAVPKAGVSRRFRDSQVAALDAALNASPERPVGAG
jgi:acetyl esterase/lipase